MADRDRIKVSPEGMFHCLAAKCQCRSQQLVHRRCTHKPQVRQHSTWVHNFAVILWPSYKPHYVSICRYARPSVTYGLLTPKQKKTHTQKNHSLCESSRS